MAGSTDEAVAAADGLIDSAEATANPYALSYALMACGFVCRTADPNRALEAMHRGVMIAHDSGNRFNETHLVANLAELEAGQATGRTLIGVNVRFQYEDSFDRARVIGVQVLHTR